MSTFAPFAKLVANEFQKIAKQPNVFVLDIDGDTLYAAYLAAFPEGTNPLFKKRTEHDCSCCRQYIKHAGNVAYVDNQDRVHTVWDTAAKEAEYPYNVVAQALVAIIGERAINNIYRVSKKENSFGAVKTHSMDEAGKALTWNHFHTGTIPASLQSATPDADKGTYRTTVQVFERGLKELSPDAIESVLGLIADNGLYRGTEHVKAVKEFQKAQQAYQLLPEKARNDFVWVSAHGPAARFRNTVIGTLVQDLSEGMDLDKAVRSFEAKVAPANYKRTSAVITPMMVKKAMETIQELGLEPALERRFARIEDISINDVKWVDNSVKSLMKGGLGDMLMSAAVAPKDTTADEKRAESISIDDFMSKVLPEASGMELLFKNEHQNNLMSLTAPAHAEPKQLFKWDNDFAWSYNGNIADSELRKAVQARGGRVDGVFRFSHTWNYDKRNASLMDLHVFMPGCPVEDRAVHDIYGNYERVGWNHRNHAKSGGVQDVDYVNAAPVGYVPVENITFPALNRMPEGKYVLKIHNWRLRAPTEGGFRAEIEFGGQVFSYEYLQPLKNKEWVKVATVTLKAGAFTIEHHLPHGTISQEKWGMKTEQYVKVKAVTLSPNYWGDNAVGNKHTFFVLDGAKNEEATRGIYNEFLHSRLEVHRKVFEVIGDKTKCQPTEGQLSGLGFSSTKRDNVVIKVTAGKKQRLYNVHIGA